MSTRKVARSPRNSHSYVSLVYFKGMNFTQALDYIEANFPESEIRNNIVRFIRNSKRGIIPKPRPGKD